MSLSSIDIELGYIGRGEAHRQEVNLGSPLGSNKTDATLRKQRYERSLKGLRIISLTRYILGTVSFFLVFCALTWATAVLLGAYVQALDKWNYIEVPILLFLEYLCVGLFAFRRTFGYSLHPKWLKEFLLNVQIFLPVAMGSLAMLGYIPDELRYHIRHRILNFFKHSSVVNAASSYAPSSIASPAKFTDLNLNVIAAETPPVPYGDMGSALKIFYALIILNAAIILSEVVINALLHWYFLGGPAAKSLRNYHDKMLGSSNSWMQPWVDLEFAFKMQSFDYKCGCRAEVVCKMYVDLVWYLYEHEGGFEAAKAAMTDSDGYVRQAAANMVGFWAVLETLEKAQEGCRLPLRFQIPLLCKLADVAAESYGAMGMAAARSIGLLLDADPVGMATKVQLGKGKGLVTILLKRVTQLHYPPPSDPDSNLARNLQKEAHMHIDTLRKLLHHLQRLAPAHAPQMKNSENVPMFTQAQREQIVREMQQSLIPQEDPAFSEITSTSHIDDIIQRLDCQMFRLLPPSPANDAGYYTHIRNLLDAPPENRSSIWMVTKIVVCNLALHVVSFFVGFFLGSFIDHSR